ncbi:MAG TPA: BlaI/MecI/CopY family transcriptional regulator [Thermoanaerobaculia bacterium]|nr:BlaI/MecI/CopY family transcriptional regulator [Thermoanaerobaculia bacterium]
MSTHKHHADPTELGRRERQIMDVIHRRGRASAAEVLEDLPDPPTYSAVRGMLRLLEEKGYIRHEWDGPRHVYLPTAKPEAVRKSAVRHLLRTFFSNSMESAVAAMLGASEKPPTDDELKRMARLIDNARRGRSRK